MKHLDVNFNFSDKKVEYIKVKYIPSSEAGSSTDSPPIPIRPSAEQSPVLGHSISNSSLSSSLSSSPSSPNYILFISVASISSFDFYYFWTQKTGRKEETAGLA